MNTLQKLLLTIAVSGCMNAYADSGVDSFFKDGTTSVSARNFYINLVSNDYPSYSPYNMTVWAQSFTAGFQSGYIDDHWGLDISAYNVQKIYAAEGFATRHVFKPDANSQAEGFNKLKVYALKQKFKSDDYTYKFYEGRRVLKDFGALTTENNATQSSYYGVTSEINSKALDVKLGYLTKYSDSDTNLNETMTTATGDTIDYIYTADVKYDWQGNEVRYYVGESQNYLRRHFFSYSKFLGDKKLTAKLFYNQGLSRWKNLFDYKRLYDDHAMQIALESEFYSPKNFVKLGYAYTSAKRTNSVGQLNFDLASNAKGNNNSPTSGVSKNFSNDRESVFYVLALHTLTPTVQIGAVGRYGYGVQYKGNNMYQYEAGLVFIWKPQSLPGFMLHVAGGPDGGFKRDYGNTPHLDSNGHWIKSHGRAVTATAEYTF